MVNYEALESGVAELSARFLNAEPFPHVILDGFFVQEAAEAVADEFSSVRGTFKRHVHQHSHKYASNDWESFPPMIRAACEELNSRRFVEWLSRLANIAPVYADPLLIGGGVHVIKPGGFLDVHADFNEHPVLKKKRCLNALIYFNRNWRDSYRGALELWDGKMERCVVKAQPILNRCVIFRTDPTSFHGHPAPLDCPKGMCRNSLATYYYTEWTDETERRLITTDYQLRPHDYAKRVRKAVRRLVGTRVAAWIDSRGRR